MCRQTVTVKIPGAKPLRLSRRAVFDGRMELEVSDGRLLSLVLGASSLGGSFGDCGVDGSRTSFSAKEKASRERAKQMQRQWRGRYVSAWPAEGGWSGITVRIGATGMATVSGRMADGTRFSVSSRFLAGESDCAVAATWTRRMGSGACLLWLSADGSVTFKDGSGGEALATMLAGSKLAAGATLRIDAAAVAAAIPGLQTDRLPSGLRLTQSRRTGFFSGRFYVYVLSDGQQKRLRASVTGVVLDGKGYGTARIRGVGSWPVTVE